MNKILIYVLLGVIFITPNISFAEDIDTNVVSEVNEAIAEDNETLNDTTIPVKEIKTPQVEDLSEMTPNANENVKREVVDSTNNHTSFVVKKFLSCMGAVCISAIILYILGLIMNRFKMLEQYKEKPIEVKEKIIQKSNDEDDALKIFFEITK